jgi:hypothetical protein
VVTVALVFVPAAAQTVEETTYATGTTTSSAGAGLVIVVGVVEMAARVFRSEMLRAGGNGG